MAAPVGGSLMILGWLALAAAFAFAAARRRP
jgi:MYXO-CTERM domain-containing protein